MAKEKNNNLMIVAIVAIVAILALMIFANRQPTATVGRSFTGPTIQLPEGGEPGNNACCCTDGRHLVGTDWGCSDYCGNHGGGGYCK